MTETMRTMKTRTLAIETPLGSDKLLLLNVHGSEALGRLFQYELDLFSEGSPVDAAKILGQNVTIRMNLPKQKTRYFNGYISRFTLVSVDESKENRKIFTYRATMVPWTWFLTRVSDCRIFQDKTVPEIVEAVFRAKQMTDFKNDTTETYRKWEYCVQYRETDFNFICRLMENEGIYFYFKHENGKHTLHFTDVPTAHSPAEGYEQLHFDQPDLSSTHDAFVWNWVFGTEITPNQYALTDYDPLNPKTDLGKSLNVEHAHDPGTFEIFDYPGGYVTPDHARFYANVRMQEQLAEYEVANGTSSARGLFAGATFTLVQHPICPEEEYLITAISYQIQGDDMGAGLGRGGAGGQGYLCQITAIPNKWNFRAARTTPKPIVQGPQTAVVVGKAGEEIWTDKYGRVKVKFFWDRESNKDETSSCWVRVSQNWAGKRWGILFTPRIGQEVIVDFLEGDPDRPIITGRVYNGENTPPYDLPSMATISAIKTNSSKGGQGFNEVRFQDKKGEEQLFIHAEKNMDIRVKNDRFENICHDRHLVVENDKYEHVKQKRHEIVEVDHMELIKNDRHLKVKGKECKEVVGTQSLKVTGDVSEKFEGNHEENTTTDYYLVAKNIVIEGRETVTVKVGKNYVAIDKSGIKIGAEEPSATFDTTSMGNSTCKSTMDFKVEATMMAGFKGTAGITVESPATADVKSAMTTVKGDGILTLKGGLTMIN
jgi:type VI secretion system secreted protein VgrG